MHEDPVKQRELELLALNNFMSTETGRAFIWRCLEECCTFTDIFNTDQSTHIHLSGQRRIGLWLESEIKEASPQFYLQMLKEHIDE